MMRGQASSCIQLTQRQENPMKTSIRVLCVLATLSLSLASQTCGGQVATQTCGQSVITGTAGPKRYNSEQECVNDRAAQQAIAEADGITKCTTFCTGLGAGCKPQPAPKPPKATPACKQQDDGKWLTEVMTGPFDCICKK